MKLSKGTYFGGKGAAGVVHRIINQIPRHDIFVSGFLGRCSVMQFKAAASRNIGFDLDAAVIAEWRDVEGVEAYQRSFFEALTDHVLFSQGTFLYLDPPYLQQTRSSSKRYRFELTVAQHLNLLRTICTLPCMVAISCYDSELYQEVLSDWRKIQFPAQTRAGVRIETLYMNYPAPMPNQLHDTRFLGDDFRAREKGKRRIETIKNKILRLNAVEQARLSDWLKNLAASL